MSACVRRLRAAAQAHVAASIKASALQDAPAHAHMFHKSAHYAWHEYEFQLPKRNGTDAHHAVGDRARSFGSFDKGVRQIRCDVVIDSARGQGVAGVRCAACRTMCTPPPQAEARDNTAPLRKLTLVCWSPPSVQVQGSLLLGTIPLASRILARLTRERGIMELGNVQVSGNSFVLTVTNDPGPPGRSGELRDTVASTAGARRRVVLVFDVHRNGAPLPCKARHLAIASQVPPAAQRAPVRCSTHLLRVPGPAAQP